MSSCLSGGGRTYAIDLDLVKSSSSTTRTSHNTSSPSSTLSESSNSPLVISTRKPRTPRKRPNQTYNEAAVLLSTAYPNLFSTKQLSKNKNPIGKKFTKQIPIHDPSSMFVDDSSDLLFPFRVVDTHTSSFLLHHQPIQSKPISHFYSKPAINNVSSCDSHEIDSCTHGQSVKFACVDAELSSFEEDFDTESILDEEIEEGIGIDSIMGNLSNNDSAIDELNCVQNQLHSGFGGRFEYEYGFGLRNGVSAFRNVHDRNCWWNFPIVDMLQISPKLNNTVNVAGNKSAGSNRTDKNKKKKVEKPLTEIKSSEKEIAKDDSSTIPKSKSQGLLLRLNYADVLNAWSGRDSPFSDDDPGSSDGAGAGNDLSARLAQIDLFSESGVREASVLRYKEKRRTRLFSKKIRYEVRKVNADQRPRMKGRFVRRQTQVLPKDEDQFC